MELTSTLKYTAYNLYQHCNATDLYQACKMFCCKNGCVYLWTAGDDWLKVRMCLSLDCWLSRRCGLSGLD